MSEQEREQDFLEDYNEYILAAINEEERNSRIELVKKASRDIDFAMLIDWE